MKVAFDRDGWADYLYWQETGGKNLARLNALIEECRHHPFRGTGKPEPLGGNLSGWWSRRIDQKHRLVYRVSGKGDAQTLEVAQCRYHH
jgi:toxin YoeB